MKNDEIDTKSIRHIVVPVTDFKYDDESGRFSCYGNVKNIIDHAQDRTVDGCFLNTIARHKENRTMPKMFWMHDPYSLPVGPWLEWNEDEKGLFLEGKLSKTSMGTDIEILAKDKALDSFSIGYRIVKAKPNETLNCYDLLEVDVLEVSWVNFACCEPSKLEDIKSKMQNGELPTKRELQKLLHTSGLSNRQAEKIANNYSPETKKIDVFELMSKVQ